MKEEIDIAIVGLGQVGTTFLKELYKYKYKGITVVGVTELSDDSPGLEFARQKAIPIYPDMFDITALGDKADVVFNLTGDQVVERQLRLAQVKLGNHKTVVVSTVMASLIWKLISEGALPVHTSASAM